jgi:hypothetical protein
MHQPPLASASPRDPDKRPRPIPKGVKAACLLMVYESVDFVTAARANGLQPTTMRRWLHRPEVVSLLRKERRAHREAICSGNETALQRVRDESENSMAKIHAVRALEQLSDGDERSRPGPISPGITINILPASAPRELVDVTPTVTIPVPAAIDARPEPRRDAAGNRIDDRGRPVDERGNPIFVPTRDW